VRIPWRPKKNRERQARLVSSSSERSCPFRTAAPAVHLATDYPPLDLVPFVLSASSLWRELFEKISPSLFERAKREKISLAAECGVYASRRDQSD
jgi:hypothetical protein